MVIRPLHRRGWVDGDDDAAAMTNRPPHVSVTAAGRDAPDSLTDVADTVSEVRDVTHASGKGHRGPARVRLLIEAEVGERGHLAEHPRGGLDERHGQQRPASFAQPQVELDQRSKAEVL